MHLLKYVRYLILAWMLLGSAGLLHAQGTLVIHRGDFDKQHEISLRDSLWVFHQDAGNNVTPDIHTNGWQAIRYTGFGTDALPKGWDGIGWFAIYVKVDTGLINRKLSLRINHDGASEIFVDGRPVGGYGQLARTASEGRGIRAPRELIPIWFRDDQPHLITIHYANPFCVYADFVGFEAFIGNYIPAAETYQHARTRYTFVLMFASAALILGLLHLLLFLFYPKRKLNLYYAMLVLLTGTKGISIYLFAMTSYPQTQYFADFMTFVTKALLMWAGLILLYVLDYRKIPRWRLFTITGVTATYLLLYTYRYYGLHNPQFPDYFTTVFLITNIDACVSIYHIIRRGNRGAWLIAAGVISAIGLYYFVWGDVFALWPAGNNSTRALVMGAGELILPICLSLYLALDFARTNQQLAEQLAEVETLSRLSLAREAERTEQVAAEARKLETIVQQRTAELKEKADKLRELDAVKSRFFSNIAHEFRTPLTLIINPVKELIGNAPNNAQLRDYRLILNNAERLLRLINQLLDLSKLEQGLMELSNDPVDLNALLLSHVHGFEPLAIQKGITLHFRSDYRRLWVYGDQDKLDKIMLNVIGNAVKFTAAGRVEVFLYQDAGDNYHIRVRDTGKGIPKAKLPHIFSRFYQADPSDSNAPEGSGIGLALCKELVELMGGSISANSWEGAFTEINIELPLTKADGLAVEEAETDIALLTDGTDELPELSPDDTTSPVILLVEDHPDLREFITRLLIGQYRVLTAANGQAGITIGMEQVPTLIITDVMMPDKDGYELCETFKNDARTSHIPIIMLTAKVDTDSRVKGIETGADAYLTKPFDKRELLALIANLISTRDKLRQEVVVRDRWLIEAPELPSAEQEFLNRVKLAVENHLDDAGYGAEQLATDIGLSRIQLHRKLKALIGQPPGELIRVVRLHYAHDLLRRRAASIAEVAYKVGFSSPASFSASFSKHFGFPPKNLSYTGNA